MTTTTVKPVITEEEFTVAIEKAVADKGEDYVYNVPDDAKKSCVYVYGGQPSCLIGQALANMGLPLDSRWDDLSSSSASHILRLFFDTPDTVIHAATRAQNTQDRMETWGEALKEYKLALKDEI